MKQYKHMTATAVALSLCLALSACSKDDSGTSDAGTGTSTPSSGTATPTEEGTGSPSSEGSSSDVTYESYLQELTTFTENFMELQAPFIAAATAFSTDYTNPEIVATYVASLQDLTERFDEISNITPTEDLVDTHQNFVDSCTAVNAVMDSMIAILEDDFASSGQEGLDAYNALYTGDYQTSYTEFATNIFAIADEIQAKMS